MIKFFRNIRQTMLSENRTSKYLLYAIGEIILVVIGILIALSINNWNSERIEHQKEQRILKEMQSNLTLDLADFRSNIKTNENKLNASRMVLQQLQEGIPFTDSMKVYYGNLMGGTIFTSNTSAYDNVKSFGFDIISNDSLRQSITQLYSEHYRYLEQLIFNMDNKVQFDQVLPQLNAKVIMDTMFVSGRPVDEEALMMDVYFQNMLRTNAQFRLFMIESYREAESRIILLKEQIASELEKEAE